jgi:thioredoxin 1
MKVKKLNQPEPVRPNLEIGEADFESVVLRSSQPVLAAFLVSWSRPCQVLKPVLDEVAAACLGRAKVVTINPDDNLGLGVSYQIQSVPTLICFVDGTEQLRFIGTATKEAILSRIQACSKTPSGPVLR